MIVDDDEILRNGLVHNICWNEKNIEVVGTARNGKGLDYDIAEGVQKGWVVWAYTDKDADLNKTAKLSFVYIEKELNVATDGKESVLPPKDKNILGGIFIVPSVTGVGVVKFLLCGIITEKEDKWNVSFPFVGIKENDGLQKKSNVEPNVTKDSLTPVEDDVYVKKVQKRLFKKLQMVLNNLQRMQ